MKLCAGLYRIPDMLSSNFSFPKGYKITNHTDKKIAVGAAGANRFFGYLPKDESICLWLEEGMLLNVDGTVEIVPFDPDKN